MGEKMLEGKTAAGQTRAAMGYSRKTQAPCLLCLAHLLAAVGTTSTKQPRKNKFLPLQFQQNVVAQFMQRSHNAIDLKAQGKATPGIPAVKGN